jgi:hypothetical protein
MDSNIKALIVKKYKDATSDLDVGRHWIDETVVIRVSGSVERHEDQWILPTVSIPLIPTIAFFWERLGVEKDRAMGILREAITDAMRAKVDESPSIKARICDVVHARGRAGSRHAAGPVTSPRHRLPRSAGAAAAGGARRDAPRGRRRPRG